LSAPSVDEQLLAIQQQLAVLQAMLNVLRELDIPGDRSGNPSGEAGRDHRRHGAMGASSSTCGTS